MPKNVWDFYDYSIAEETMHFISEGDDRAEILIRKSGEEAIEIGISLGDKKRWFPLTEDATYALADLLSGAPIGGEGYTVSVSPDFIDDSEETDEHLMGYHGLGYDPRAY
jgi:hypothetical protein